MADAAVRADAGGAEAPRFAERPTNFLVEDAYALAGPPAVLAVVAAWLGWGWLAWTLALAAIAVAAFFRNPSRTLPPGEDRVVAPADGRVIHVGETRDEEGAPQLQIGIFLSVFDVHVNRMPLSGRVLAIERGGTDYRAAFRGDAADRNVYCRIRFETREGFRVSVTQITGWIARRIVCHPRLGEWVARGERYGLIRFGSRTDVTLPLGSRVRVARGDRVRGGVSILADLPEPGAAS